MFRLKTAIIRRTNTKQVRLKLYNCQLSYASRSRVRNLKLVHICTIVKPGVRKSSNTWFNYCTYVHQFKIPYKRSRCVGQLSIAQFSSYLFCICTPDDGSLEPKHVASCLLLSKIK